MTITNVKTLAERLTYARELRGLSQAELAKNAKCAQSAIGNVESGTRLTLRNLVLVARALGVSADWLYDGKGPKPVANGNVVKLPTYPETQTLQPMAADVSAPSSLVPKIDPFAAEILVIMAGLDENQKLGAIARLREYVSFLGPPRDGQTLSMAV